MSEVVNAYAVHQPGRPPGLTVPVVGSVLEIPVVHDASAGFFDRNHRLALDASRADHPSEPTAEDQHKDDQPPDAYPEPVPPRCWKGLVRHLTLSTCQPWILDHPLRFPAAPRAECQVSTIIETSHTQPITGRPGGVRPGASPRERPPPPAALSSAPAAGRAELGQLDRRHRGS